MTAIIRVVVIDDSPFVCRLLTNYLQMSPDLQVVGTALNGRRAVKLIRELRPDAVTLDLEMAGMSGLETLEQIMHDCPCPVIVVSGASHHSANLIVQAIGLGAVDFVLKYTPGADTDPEALRQEITAKTRAASRIKVVRSLRRLPGRVASRRPPVVLTKPFLNDEPSALSAGVVVIGASTGGPVALRELLGNLPGDFPVGVIIVQHMPAGFTGVLAAQLGRQVQLKVREAKGGDPVQPGVVLVAPGGKHLLLRPDLRVALSRSPEVQGHRPSVDVTMQSAAQVYGARTIGVVLTGMGSDGTHGLASIRAKGGKTFAQDAASCCVNGMPQRAIEKGVVDHVAPPAEIARLLRRACELTSPSLYFKTRR